MYHSIPAVVGRSLFFRVGSLEGMSMGSAAVFMIPGPATKITNLGALKIVMGEKRFILNILFVIVYAFTSVILINIFL